MMSFCTLYNKKICYAEKAYMLEKFRFALVLQIMKYQRARQSVLNVSNAEAICMALLYLKVVFHAFVCVCMK